MRSAVILVSAAIAVVVAITAVALAADDSDASHVGTEEITFTGYTGGFTSYDASDESKLPVIYIFVAYEQDTFYKYENVKNDALLSGYVSANTDSDGSKNNLFSITVPLINAAGADYYLCAFNNYKVNGVSSFINPAAVTITADDTWADTPQEGKEWKVWKIDSSVWSGAHDGDKFYITGEYDTVNKEPSVDLIFLTGAYGSASGHVNGVIANNTDNLNDVLVQFYKNDRFIDSTRTGSNGIYRLENLPTGDYKVTFSRGNYTCDPIYITIYDGAETDCGDIDMTLTVHNDYFGYDLAHFLTIMGGIVCAAIIFISIAFQWRRIKRNKSGKDWILDDQQEMDGLDEDE